METDPAGVDIPGHDGPAIPVAPPRHNVDDRLQNEFGLGWNQVLEAGGLLVGEKIEIVLDVQAVKAPA